MLQDILTTQKLVDTMQTGNEVLRGKIDNVLGEERVLDGPPSKYSPLRIATDTLEPFGMYKDYRRMYSALYNQQPPSDGKIIIEGAEVHCPYKVLTALKALIACGVTKSSERANACRELFGKMLSRRKANELTEALIQPALKSSGDYYRNEIARAIVDCLYTPLEQVEIALKDALGDGYRDDIVALFDDVTDMDSFEEMVNKVYKKACCDASFKVEKRLGKIVNGVRYLEKLQDA